MKTTEQKLIKLADSPGVSPWAMAAKNIRTELRHAFPGIKFSVTSDSYSMGCSVDVRWTDGPTEKEVDALIRDYSHSEFDGMQDLSTYVDKAKHAYGSAKHIMTSRNTSALQQQIEAALKPLVHEEEHYMMFRNENIQYRIAARTSLKAGQRFKGIRRKEGPAVRAAACFSDFYEVELESEHAELPTIQAGQVIKTKHTQKGFDLFVIQLPQRVSREAFSAFLAEAKQLGGWYSSYAVGGAVPGFQFKTELSANAFLHVLDGKPSLESAQAQDAASADCHKVQAKRLRDMADGMGEAIESKLNSATSQQNPTPRRIRIANGMRSDGEHLQRVQEALRKVADCIESGNAPFAFLTLKFSKSAISEAIYKRGEPALVKWLHQEVPKIEEDPKAKKIREIEQGFVGVKMPGFFPTPPELVERMKSLVCLAGSPLILEPSAGSGAIACALNGGSVVHCCEIRPQLAELLKLKGQRVVAGDFLEYDPGAIYDIVLMNPPFENRQAVAHVFHAWQCLKPGGKLVAILPESVAFNSDSDYEELRQWIDEHGGELEDVEAGAFAKSGTNVKTRMLVMKKEAA